MCVKHVQHQSQPLMVCVSSRPLALFQRCFADCSSLSLLDLTYPDMVHYVTAELLKSPEFVEQCRGQPDEAPSLMERIVQQSPVVFISVRLTVGNFVEVYKTEHPSDYSFRGLVAYKRGSTQCTIICCADANHKVVQRYLSRTMQQSAPSGATQ